MTKTVAVNMRRDAKSLHPNSKVLSNVPLLLLRGRAHLLYYKWLGIDMTCRVAYHLTDWCQNTLPSALKFQRELSRQWSNKWRCSIYYEILVTAPLLLDKPSLCQTQTMVFTMVSETVYIEIDCLKIPFRIFMSTWKNMMISFNY